MVGVSGVGKTKILEAIRSLQKIVFGNPGHNRLLNGVEWDITFSTDSDQNYRWKGKFNIINNYEAAIGNFSGSKYLTIEQNEPILEIEELYLNDNCITSRNDGIIRFEEQIMPKLSPTESLITIFQSEDRIIPVSNGLRLITDSHTQRPKRSRGSSKINKKVNELSLSSIKNTSDTLADRIRLIEIKDRDMFAQIKSDFIKIFPQIENFRISTYQLRSLKEA